MVRPCVTNEMGSVEKATKCDSVQVKNSVPAAKETVVSRNGDLTDEETVCENGKMKELENDIAPPKPKPRSSRSNSVDFVEDRPIAKPRTHKNSIDSVQGLLLEKADEEDGLTGLVIEKIQPCVIQSVNPNMPISGGYKVRLSKTSIRYSLHWIFMVEILKVISRMFFFHTTYSFPV